MTPTHRDLQAPELWERSLARSRLRRTLAPPARREHKRPKGLSAAAAAATMAGPGAPMAFAHALAGIFGPQTDRPEGRYENRSAQEVGGLVGTATWGALFESGSAVVVSNVS